MEYYCHASTGSDVSGDGTSSRPWKTLAKAKTAIGTPNDGDILNIAGTFQESLTWDSLTGFWIRQWSGQTQAWITCARDLAPEVWTGPVGSTYTTNIGAGLGLGYSGVAARPFAGSVVVDYENRYDSIGHYGHYKCVSGAASPYSWDYNNATGVLSVNIGGLDSNPTVKPVGYIKYVLFDIVCLQMHASTRCRISGIKFGPVSGIGGGFGYNYGFIGSGTDNIIEDCLFVDCGYHAWGFVSNTNVRNKVINTVCRGMISAATTPQFSVTMGVFHCTNGVNITGARAINCDFHCFSYRYPDRTAIDTTAAIDACHTHTSGSTEFVDDVAYENCRAFYYTNLGIGNGFTAQDPNTSLVPADGSAAEVTASSYPIRLKNCIIYNGTTAGFVSGGAIENCYYFLLNPPQGQHFSAPTTGKTKTAFFGSYIAGNLYNAAAQRSFFKMQRTDANNYSSLIAVNSAFVDTSSSTPYWPRLMTWQDSGNVGRVRIIGSVIRGNQNQGISLSVGASDSQATSSAFTFTDNLYYWIDPNAWIYGSTSLDTQAEFSAAKDTTGVYATNPSFASPTTSAAPTSGSGLATLKKFLTTRVRKGVNRLLYNGRYGPWQDGNPGRSLTRRLLTSLDS